jgi:hypothetical protein
VKISYHELLHVFGVNPDNISQFVPPADPTKTAMVPIDLQDRDSFSFHLKFGSEGYGRETNLLPASPEKWPALPFNVFKFDTEPYRYALVGSSDDSMGELIPPGSLVEVDTKQTEFERSVWHALRDRPIYLVWHTDGYSCCWCQQERGELTLVPHPSSQQPVRRFKTSRDATVVGRVVSALMPFTDTEGNPGAPLLM